MKFNTHGSNYRRVRWNAFRNFTKHRAAAIVTKSYNRERDPSMARYWIYACDWNYPTTFKPIN